MKTVASICMVLKVMAIMPTWMQTGVVSVPVAKLACEVNSIDTNFWYECSRQMEEPCVLGRHLKIPEANCSAGTVDKNQLCVSCPEGTYLDFRNHCDECLKWTECGPGMMENPALLPNILRDRDCIPITAFTGTQSLSAQPEISDNISTSTADASNEMNMSHPMGNSSLPAPQPMDDDDIGYKAAIGGLAGLVLVLIVILVVIAVKCHLGRKSVEWKRDCDQQQEQPQEPQIHRNARGASADNRDDADGNQEEEARHLLAEDPPPSSSSRGDGQAHSAEASRATVMVHPPPASVNSPPTSGPVNCGSPDAASNDILADSYLSWLAKQITPKEKVALSTQLGFNDAQLKCVETEYQGDTRRQNYEMLLNWRKRAEGDGLSKVRQLGQALANEQVGRTDLRDELFSRYVTLVLGGWFCITTPPLLCCQPFLCEKPEPVLLTDLTIPSCALKVLL
ncbi:uncharacterized protein LOC110986557 isoform X2 [Acanthaster planci]|uniref:Uncharacterized protein LOC110986557 isoform X2 n=1 Tax=Acanthaster planci TaxID=133434 RepID=A0A8B7ZEZ1_ACAPL|nr:uncharacterized protein LOC110986557 isoform X2 [Acanthaster planci]